MCSCILKLLCWRHLHQKICHTQQQQGMRCRASLERPTLVFPSSTNTANFRTTFSCVCTVCLLCRQPGVGFLKTTSNQIMPTSLGDSPHMKSKLPQAGMQLQADEKHPTLNPTLPEEVASNHMYILCTCIALHRCTAIHNASVNCINARFEESGVH